MNTTRRQTKTLAGQQHMTATVDLSNISDFLFGGKYSQDTHRSIISTGILTSKGVRCYWDDDDDYDNDYGDSDYEEPGCGEGWTCSHCPNYGCPANEYN